MSHKFYEVGKHLVLASSQEQAEWFVQDGRTAEVEGDPGIVAARHDLRYCSTEHKSPQPARANGLCHLCDPAGAFRQNMRKAA